MTNLLCAPHSLRGLFAAFIFSFPQLQAKPAAGSSAERAPGAKGNSEQITSPDQVPQGLAKSDWQSIRSAREAGRHAFQPVQGKAGHWQARNPGQQWHTTFDQRGFMTSPLGGGWTWGLELESYGFGEKQTSISGTPQVEAEGQRLAYQWDATVQEWFVNDQRGLEHGFTLAERPAADSAPGSQPTLLSFTLSTRGGLTPKVASDSVQFLNATGTTVLNYSGLKVWDADGKTLPARFEPSGTHGFRLLVEESAARYPITIDPVAQQAYLKASNPKVDDRFGYDVAVDGDTAVVGAPQDFANPADSGAAYVFIRSAGVWSQQAILRASNAGASDSFGVSVAVDGDAIIVGAWGEDSSARTVNGDGSNNSATDSGAAYVFTRTAGVWTEQAYLKASNADLNDRFGYSVDLSGDTVVIGAWSEGSNATTVNGNAANNSATSAGAAYVFTRSAGTWTQQAYLKASNSAFDDNFGWAVAVDGDTVVVGAPKEDSNATTVNGNGADNTFSSAGAAYVFVRSAGVWTQQAYLKAINSGPSDQFGYSVDVSGNTVVIGAIYEASNATTVNGSGSNNSAPNSGAAYVFTRSAGAWTQQAYLKANNSGVGDNFGVGVAVKGEVVVVGAQSEDGSSTGINGTSDDLVSNAGAAYVFVRSSGTWSQQSYLKASQVSPDDFFGRGVAVSGGTVVIGATNEDSSSTGINSTPNEGASNSGAAYIFTGLGPVAPAPTVTNVSPATGSTAGGTSVVITGTNLTDASAVTFGGTNATSFTVDSATQITATTPAGTAGAASVLVTTPGGTNAANTLFTYVAPPTVTNVSPATGSTAGGTAVIITGTNLTDASAVTFGGTNVTSFTVNSATQITATTPAGTAGTASVLVTTPGGTNAANTLFTYVAPPTVTNVSPATGSTAGGTSVVITGTNLTDASAVTFGGTNATSFTVNSATQITATTPAGTAGTASVLVTTPGGTNAANTLFTYVAPPTVTNVSPATGSTAGGTSVVITGTNLTDASAVTFGGTNATSFTVNSATQITATTPAGTAGTASVLVTTPGGTNAANTLFTYVAPPTVTNVSPATGSTAGGTSVVITGTNLTDASAVTFGGTNVTSFTVNSATQITATTPAGTAGTASVLVTTAGGTNAANTLFTYVAPTPVAALEAYLKASNTGADDRFGSSVDVDGDTAVVGAPQDANVDAGMAYVFTRSAGVWSQQAILVASNAGVGDFFGGSVAVDGDTIVVSASSEDSNARTVNGDGSNNSASNSGAAYVFTRTAGVWTQQAYLKANNADADDLFGYSVDVSGETIVVGAVSEDGNAATVNGNGLNNSLSGAGAAYVFTRSAGVWTQQAYLKPLNAGLVDNFGWSVAVDGDSVVVGAPRESSNATTVNGNGANDSATGAGAAYVFTRNAGVWSQQAYLKANNSGAADEFGRAVDVSGDTVVVGAFWESSNATTVNGDGSNNSLSRSGAAYVFTRSAGAWTQQAYLKANNSSGSDEFGRTVAVDGEVVVIGAPNEDGSSTGINGASDDLVSNAGAVYVFVRSSGTWSQQSYLKASQVSPDDFFSRGVAVSGGTVVVGAYFEDSSSTGINSTPNEGATNAGAAYIFSGLGPVAPAPTVTNVSPATGSTLGGTVVTITGTDFTGATAVTFGGTAATSFTVDSATQITATTPARAAGVVSVEVTTAGGTNAANSLYTYVAPTPLAVLEAYLKAGNAEAGDLFGQSVAVSGDTAVVGAYWEASNATGVNGNSTDNSAPTSGAAYIFTRSAGVWTQQAYLKASNSGENDYFGSSVAISGDTVVIGAFGEASSATGVNGDGTNNSSPSSGAAYVFTRSGTTWTEQAYLKASNSGMNDNFGYSVSVSGDTAVIGAFAESSSATGVGGNQADNSVVSSGAAYVFTRSGTTWSQQAYLKASNTGEFDQFGISVAVSGDTAIIGASGEASNATGVNGNGADNSASFSGAAYIFSRSGTTWSQQAYLKASNSGADDYFGQSVSMSGDTAIVGAYGESSNATGVNGNGANNDASYSGAAYIFSRTGGVWSEQAYLKASNAAGFDYFGIAVSVSGNTAVVGAFAEDSNATGVGGNQADNSASASGAAYVFTRSAGVWTQQNYLKASNSAANDRFGSSVAVSGDTALIGASFEDSNATTVGGDGSDNSASSAGAAYIFDLNQAAAAPTVTNVSPATGSTLGGTVVTITGTDFTGATAVTFGGTNATSFTVDSATQITATTPAHAAGAVSVLVTTPGGTNAANTLYTYEVGNLPPVITSNGGDATASISVAENTTAVTTVTATDADLPAQTLTYTKSGADAALFNLDSATGVLRFITAPNYEAPADSGLNNIYDVTVTVTDSGMPNLFDSQDLFIIVTDVNESPAIKPSSSYLAYETVNPTRNASGLIVYTTNNAATLGAQPFNRVRYRMENTTGGVAYFADASFDAWSGLTIAELKVPDAGNILTTRRNVTNVSIRSNHPRVVNSNTEIGRLEHWTNNYSPQGIIGGSASLYDYDDTPETPIVGYGSFQLHNLSATVPETVFAWNNHSLGVTPEVGFGNSTIGIHPDWTFTNTGTNAWRMQIYIENNFVPPTMSFTEDVTGNILFFNSPFQDDSASLTVTLAVADGTVTGNAGTGITVGGTATSRTFSGSVADLNAYFTTPGKVTYLGALNNTVSRTLTVTVSDGSLSTNTTSTLHLAPVNDVPTDIAVTPSNVPENYEPNTVVGTLSTTDPDVGDTFTYSLVAGTGAVDNASFSIVGNTLRITPSVDFETKPSYSIRVRTTEASTAFFEKALTISVRDLLEQDIAYDDFRRPSDSGSGWSGNWSVANPAVANLVYPSLNSGGNAAGSGAGQRFRSLSSAQTTGVVYVSALLKGGGYCNLTLYDGSQEKVSFGVVYDPLRGTFNPNFGLFDETRKFEGAAAMVPSTVAVDTATHFILARVDLDLNTVDMWVDPNLSLPLGAPNCTSRAGSFGGSNYDFNRVRLEVTGAAVMDEVRIMAGDRRLVANRTTSASITSPTVANVKNTKATLGGDITQTGGSAILERGVVYAPTATNNNPEAGGTGVGQTMASGTSTGVFSVEVTGLLAGTNYSYKAYARNAIGTTYTLTTGTFTTLTLPEPIAADSGDVISNGLATGANGTSPVGSYGVLRRGGFLAENGVFAYPGYLLTGSGSPAVTVSDNSGIWKVQGGNPLLVARTGTTVPDVPGARFATLPEVPGLSEAGDVSMLSTLVIGSGGVTSANDSGLWSEIGGGGLRLLLREDDNVPSLAGVKVGAFASGVYATARTGASAGEAVFSVTFKGASTKTALLRTSVSGATTTVSVVAQEGEVAPGASPAANYVSVAGSYSDPGRMDAQGNFVYSALTTPGNKEGIWYQPVTGGTPNKVFFAGETAPGTGGATFARLQRPSMGSNGFISFRATLNRDGDNAANARNDGIWNGSAANPASFTCVLRRGDGVAKVSNLPVGSLVGNPWGGWLTNSNLGAWRAWLDVDGDGISSTADGDVNAIFANLSGAMQLAVKVGDAAPGTAGATFSGFDLPMVGGNNQYAILGNLTGGDTVTANNQGLWKSAPNGGALRLAIRKGETIVTTEGPKTVTKIDVPGSNQTDRRWEQPVMDSAGRMVVFVTFADGSTSQVIIP